MRQWKRFAGVICVSAVAVYSGWAGNATSATINVPPGGAQVPAILPDVIPDSSAAVTEIALPAATQPTVSGTAAVALPVVSDAPAGGKPTTQPVGAAPKVTLSDAGTFSIQINNDVSLVELLRMIGSQAQVSIIPSKEVHGSVPAMDLYNVTVHEALDALLTSNGYVYKEKGNFIYVYGAKELADLDKQNRSMATEVFRIYYTPAANAVNMIKPVLSSEAQVSFTTPASSGIESGAKDVGGDAHATQDMIVITDYPENLDKVRKVIKEVDRRPQQILIEATILRATLSEDNAMGIDFSILGSVNFADLTKLGHTASDALSGSILSDSASSGVVANGYNGAGTSFTQNVPTGGLQVGVVQNDIAVFLRALESVTDTSILANPKVLALDKQRGEVIVGRQDGYMTTTVTQNAQTQTVEFLDTGTHLVFRPFIGDDGYIRMEVHPEDSSGGLTGANLPYKVTTEVTSNIMVKDGHTVLIGGLFRESSNTTRAQVPFLGNLPFAGPLFRQQRDQTTREEIIILLTPHIVKDEQAFSDASEAEYKEMEKLRVGVRQGMMPFGRERLAETSYNAAVEEMHKTHPDMNTVRWHLDCATNLNPTMREAIDLKQKVTGRELSEADNSSVRGFIKRQIMADRVRATTQPANQVDELTPPGEVLIDDGKRTPRDGPTTGAVINAPAVAKPPDALSPLGVPPSTVVQTK